MNRSDALGRINDLIIERNAKTGIKRVTIGLMYDMEEFNKILLNNNNTKAFNDLIKSWEKEA